LRRPIVPDGVTHNAHMYYVLLPDLAARTEFIAKLRALQIGTVFHYVPLHSSPFGQHAARSHGNMSNTTDLSDRLVRLPLWVGLNDYQPDVIEKILEVLGN
ncbi:DegT/DnrJ/EryC1/StrS family aminotransferase, partial [Roseateles sp.]|uniref:DegT/DnrJ/EryC1/StrS family aminotransferase n=1 Tax=Roseateles sp. TaxID=1971397 RepID=UPI00286AAA89